MPVAAAFFVSAGVAYWRHRPAPAIALAGLGAALLIAGVVAPGRLGPLQRKWMGLAYLLSRFTTPVFMAVLYFLVITPIGLFMRAIGHRPLRHSMQNGGFWTKPVSGGRSDMNRQF